MANNTPAMQPDPVITALTRCGNECRTATNGHGRRWAVERCTKALMAAGTPPSIAANSAQGMARVAQLLRDGASRQEARDAA